MQVYNNAPTFKIFFGQHTNIIMSTWKKIKNTKKLCLHARYLCFFNRLIETNICTGVWIYCHMSYVGLH